MISGRRQETTATQTTATSRVSPNFRENQRRLSDFAEAFYKRRTLGYRAGEDWRAAKPRPLLSMTDVSKWSRLPSAGTCNFLVAHIKLPVQSQDGTVFETRKFIVRQNRGHRHHKCDADTPFAFPASCDWPIGEIVAFEFAFFINVSTTLPIVLGGVLNHARFQAVLRQQNCQSSDSYTTNVGPRNFPNLDFFSFTEMMEPAPQVNEISAADATRWLSLAPSDSANRMVVEDSALIDTLVDDPDRFSHYEGKAGRKKLKNNYTLDLVLSKYNPMNWFVRDHAHLPTPTREHVSLDHAKALRGRAFAQGLGAKANTKLVEDMYHTAQLRGFPKPFVPQSIRALKSMLRTFDADALKVSDIRLMNHAQALYPVNRLFQALYPALAGNTEMKQSLISVDYRARRILKIADMWEDKQDERAQTWFQKQPPVVHSYSCDANGVKNEPRIGDTELLPIQKSWERTLPHVVASPHICIGITAPPLPDHFQNVTVKCRVSDLAAALDPLSSKVHYSTLSTSSLTSRTFHLRVATQFEQLYVGITIGTCFLTVASLKSPASPVCHKSNFLFGMLLSPRSAASKKLDSEMAAFFGDNTDRDIANEIKLN